VAVILHSVRHAFASRNKSARLERMTMMIQLVSDNALDNNCRSLELSTGKKEIRIFIGGSFTSVCVKNAAHSVWKGCGRVFHGNDTLAQAVASYKDSAVKAMIETAMEIVAA